MNDIRIEAEVASTYDDGSDVVFGEEALFILSVLSPGTDITGIGDGKPTVRGRVESARVEGGKVVVQAVVFAGHEDLFRQYSQIWLVPKISISDADRKTGSSTIHSLRLVDFLFTTSPLDITISPVRIIEDQTRPVSAILPGE